MTADPIRDWFRELLQEQGDEVAAALTEALRAEGFNVTVEYDLKDDERPS